MAADRADRAEASFFERKARLLPERGRELNALGAKQPDLTLAQIKERLRLACTIPAIHQVLAKLGINCKKMHNAAEQNRPDIAKARRHRPGWSSSTSRPPRRT